MKKVVGLLKEAGVEQRSRVKEAVQTALQDGSLQASVESRPSPRVTALCTLPPSRSPCFTQLRLRTRSTEPKPEPEP